MKRLYLVLITFVLCFVGQDMKAAELHDMYKSFAQVYTVYTDNGVERQTGRHSAMVFAEYPDRYVLLTAGHGPSPAPRGSTTYVRFFHWRGVASNWMRGAVEWWRYDPNAENRFRNDVAFIVLPKSEFRRSYYPAPIPVRISTVRTVSNSYVNALGHAYQSSYPTAYLGYVFGDNSQMFWFHPAGKVGRSGSPVFDSNGRLVGMHVGSGEKHSLAVNSIRLMEHWDEYQAWRTSNYRRDESQ